MSLRVWLPLTKDLRNQGLDDITVTNNGATFNSAGKLGGCYQFGNGSASSNGLFLNSNLVDVMQEEYSVAVWVKPLGNHYHYNGTIFSSGDWNKTRYSFGLSQDNSQVDILCKGHNNYLTCAVPINTWTHLICTCDSNNIVRLYKNGEYINSSARNDKPDSDNANQAAIGRETYANGYFTFNGMLNDFRLYDHCLSPMEIKQISQGLILHYPLNRGGWGQENLLVDTYNWSTLTSASTVSEGYWYNNGGTAMRGYDNINNITYCKIWHSDSGSWVRYSRQYITMQPNTYYTVSILCRINTDIAHLSIRNDRNEAITFFASNVELTNKNWEWKFFTAKTHTNTSQEPFTIYAQVNSDGVLSSDTSIDIAMIKLEKGSIATPWCPNSSDELATTLGLNDNVEYDTSGYGNNGTRIGTFSWTSDTPKYNVSTIFTEGCSISTINNLANPCSEFSVGGWVNLMEGYVKNNGCHLITFNGTYCRICISKDGLAVRILLTNGSTNYMGGSTLKDSALTANKWNYFVITFKNGIIKIYINGLLDADLTANITQINFPSSNISIGQHGSEKPNAKVSDFRIYATALSAEDIKSLYNNSAYIDNQGNIYGAVYEEV